MFTDISYTSIGEAMETAGHNYEVGKVPLILPDGQRVPDKMATVRTDTNEYLGTVGADYKVVQPIQFYELADEFLKQTPGATIDRAVTIKCGAVMGLSFHIDTSEFVPGDPIRMEFLMMTSFNMQFSILGRALSKRLFCLNQLPSSNALFEIKHTTFAERRLGVAMKMLSYFGNEHLAFKDRMKSLVKYQMTERAMVEWFRGLFPKPKADSKRANSILENNTESFVRLLSEGKGTDIPGVRGTGYHALNALTEYVNHHRSTRVKAGRDPQEVRWEATVFGSGNALMQRGFNGLIEMVKHEPSNKWVVA